MVRLAIVYIHNIKDEGICFYTSYNALVPPPYYVCDSNSQLMLVQVRTMGPVTIQS